MNKVAAHEILMRVLEKHRNPGFENLVAEFAHVSRAKHELIAVEAFRAEQRRGGNTGEFTRRTIDEPATFRRFEPVL